MNRMALLVAALCVAMLGVPSWAVASEKQVLEEILDILRSKGEISDEQYEELQQRAAEPESPSTFRVYWQNGVRLETADKAFQIRIGGRIQTDWAVIAEDSSVARHLDNSSTQTGVEFRRARLYMSGTIYEHFDFKAQYDFAGGDVAFKGVWLGVKKVPVLQRARVGHFKEPFSLERLTSSNNNMFMERGLPSAFAPGRNTGVGVDQNALDKRVTWAFGGFRETDGSGIGFGGDSEYNVSARITGLPLYEDGGRRLVHLGFSYSHEFRYDDQFRFRRRPEAHLADRFVDTNFLPAPPGGSIDFTADGIDLINPEFAAVLGPFSVQAEYMRAFVDSAFVVVTPQSGPSMSSSLGNPQFDGLYVFGSYFITGEHRVYKKSDAKFGRLKPKRNFLGKDGGCGAWEVAARFSRIDLNGGGVKGGALDDVTAGINWYMNPNVRVTFNYVWAHLESVGDTNIAEGRFQIAF